MKKYDQLLEQKQLELKEAKDSLVTAEEEFEVYKALREKRDQVKDIQIQDFTARAIACENT